MAWLILDSLPWSKRKLHGTERIIQYKDNTGYNFIFSLEKTGKVFEGGIISHCCAGPLIKSQLNLSHNEFLYCSLCAKPTAYQFNSTGRDKGWMFVYLDIFSLDSHQIWLNNLTDPLTSITTATQIIDNLQTICDRWSVLFQSNLDNNQFIKYLEMVVKKVNSEMI